MHQKATSIQAPPSFAEFMRMGFHESSLPLPAINAGSVFAAARRSALSKRFPNDVLVIPSGEEKVRNNDVNYEFRASSDFIYLSLAQEPQCVLVMIPKEQGHESILLMPVNLGHADASFYTDSSHGEFWVEPRLGVAQMRHHVQIDRCEDIAHLPDLLAAYEHSNAAVRILPGVDKALEESTLWAKPEDGVLLAEYLADMRLCKDAHEIALLKRACEATRRGFEAAIQAIPKATHGARDIETAFFKYARGEGRGVGYGTTAATGHRACTLHHTINDGPIEPGELLLLDAGVELAEGYTADITRTLPLSGTFTQAQRDIYDLVAKAQAAGIAAVVPGADFSAPHSAARDVLNAGLIALGIPGDRVAHILENQGLLRRYTVHGTSHHLGLDVHDCANARNEAYGGPMKAGMVITVEPGLYFRTDDETVPEKYRGIGVRIEDDILVTDSGAEILSDMPRTSHDVEAWMRSLL